MPKSVIYYICCVVKNMKGANDLKQNKSRFSGSNQTARRWGSVFRLFLPWTIASVGILGIVVNAIEANTDVSAIALQWMRCAVWWWMSLHVFVFGLIYLLGGIRKWIFVHCAIQVSWRFPVSRMNPRLPWKKDERRNAIAIGVFFIVLGLFAGVYGFFMI